MVLVLLMAGWNGSRAEAITTVQATVDRNEIAIDETVELTVTITGEQGNVDTGAIRDFKVTSRGTSRRINMVNGQFSQETVFSYTLSPLKTGALLVPPLRVLSEGNVYTTEPIRIRVTKENQSDQNGTREVILEATVSDRTPYVGEPLIYTFRLSNAVQLANARLERPDFDGFTVSEVDDRKNFRRTISGVPYEVTELYYALIPVTPGSHEIAPSVLSCDVLRQSSGRRGILNDPFFGFGRTRLESRVFRTPALTVEVRPLPPDPEGKPFSGLIGEFTLNVSLTPPKLKAGESATLSIAVEGQGNFLDMTEPKVVIPDGFKSYRDAPEEDIRVSPTGYRGRKVYRVALVPMEPGTHSLAPVQLRIFDPVRGVYETLSSGPLVLNVTPGDAEAAFESVTASPESSGGANKESVEFTGRDILPLKENLKALESTVPLSPEVFMAWLAAPAVLFLFAWLVFRRRRAPLRPEKMMMDRADGSLKSAAKALEDDDLFFSFLYRSVISAVLAKAGMPGEALTSPEARRILQEKRYPEDLGSRVTRVIEQIESAKFGGRSMETAEKRTLLSETGDILKALK